MVLKTTVRRGAPSRGFTLVELLLAMALILFIMVVLSEAFVAGLETYRQLKGIGDMNERMRSAVIDFRRFVGETGGLTSHFVGEGLRRGYVDPGEADALHDRYRAITADALDLEDLLRELEDQTVNPAARRVLNEALEALRGVRVQAARMVELLELIPPPK
jgi:prepilin-type N-terminal cleavage/methylation domain-containing protein